MKIAVIGIRGLPDKYSGFETCAANTTIHWSKKAGVLVYCRKAVYKTKPTHTDCGVKLKYLPCLRFNSLKTLTHTFLCCLNLIFFNRSYKVVHIYNCANGVFIPLLRIFGFRTIISVDGIEWKRKKWSFWGRKVFKLGAYFSVKFSNAIVTDNKVVYDFYLKEYSAKTHLIAYGAKSVYQNPDQERKLLQDYCIKSKNYFIFIGRFVPEKGVLNLIKSYLKTNLDKPLVIVGDDASNSEYRNHIFDNYSNNPRIKLVGYLYGDKYEMLLKNALMYVSASELEGTSPSLLMAMKAEVPCLVNGIPENIATAESSIFYFNENDLEDLSYKLESLSKDKEGLVQSTKKALSLINLKYSWEVISKEYYDLFETLK